MPWIGDDHEVSASRPCASEPLHAGGRCLASMARDVALEFRRYPGRSCGRSCPGVVEIQRRHGGCAASALRAHANDWSTPRVVPPTEAYVGPPMRRAHARDRGLRARPEHRSRSAGPVRRPVTQMRTAPFHSGHRCAVLRCST
jgi:hypothetical protein